MTEKYGPPDETIKEVMRGNKPEYASARRCAAPTAGLGQRQPRDHRRRAPAD
jgi:hypothetical protein